jgi:hypothetical protein
MAVTTGPLMSVSAKGQFGKAIVYSSWKGIQTAKKYTIPANPSTSAQVETRTTFQWVHDAYKYLPADVQEPWIEYVKGQPMTPANAWMQANSPVLRGQTTIADIIFTKPVRSGPPTASLTATPGSGSVALVAVPSGIISGWTITKCVGIAMQNVDPSGEMEFVISTSGEATTSPYDITISGLKHAQSYVCGAFFKYARPDLQIAFGAAITQVVTTT